MPPKSALPARGPGPARSYDRLYENFDTPLMRRLREQAYGEDIGQHSWVTAQEMREDLGRLSLDASARLLDLGCGPCGPLVFAIKLTGCTGTGLDSSGAALASGQARATAAQIGDRVRLLEADLNQPATLPSSSFDAAMSLDVVLHLRSREAFYRELAKLLVPGGRLLVSDAGVIAGPISSEEISQRCAQGTIHFVPPGTNEALLEAAGFRLQGQQDRTLSALVQSRGRLTALRSLRTEFEAMFGPEVLQAQERYLETIATLSERRALTRIAYFATRRS